MLQAAAVIGKEFPEPVLRAGRRARAGRARRRASRAGRRRVRLRAGALSRGVYAFKHPLTQEVAYGSQLGGAPRRRSTPQLPGRSPSTTRSGSTSARRCSPSTGRPRASRSRRRAGTPAPAPGSGTSDPTSALRHWDKVRELTDTVPDRRRGGARACGEDLLAAVRLAPGTSHEEAETMFKEAEEMAAKAGDMASRAILLALYGGIRGTIDGDAQESARLVTASGGDRRGVRRRHRLHVARRGLVFVLPRRRVPGVDPNARPRPGTRRRRHRRGSRHRRRLPVCVLPHLQGRGDGQSR